MARNLRLGHVPAWHPVLRWSGYLTAPATDAQVAGAIGLSNFKLWRARASLPADWPVKDDPMIQQPPGGVTPIWGEGNVPVWPNDIIGDNWRLLIGSGQLAIDALWLYDPKADPWPQELGPCPPCKPSDCPEAVCPPSECHPFAAALAGSVFGAAGTMAIWWTIEGRAR